MTFCPSLSYYGMIIMTYVKVPVKLSPLIFFPLSHVWGRPRIFFLTIKLYYNRNIYIQYRILFKLGFIEDILIKMSKLIPSAAKLISGTSAITVGLVFSVCKKIKMKYCVKPVVPIEVHKINVFYFNCRKRPPQLQSLRTQNTVQNRNLHSK